MSNPQPEKKKTNPFVWFLFAIIVPVVAAVVIAVVIMTMAGVNVGDWLKQTGSNLPIISSFIQTDEEMSIEILEQQLARLTEEKDHKIAELEATIEDHVYQIDRLRKEIEEAEELQRTEDTVVLEEEPEEDGSDPLKEMALSYEEMNHKQAARIIEEMDDEVALALIDALPTDIRGKIIEKMNPEHARDLTVQFINQ